MPIVHAARLRMRYLDQILRNHNRKYTVLEIKDMINLKTGIGISKETVYQDLQYLKREFDAKIIKNSYNQYYYEDPEFSIEKAPLSDDDKILLDVATSIFKQFKSSPIFEKFETVINKILTGSAITKIERNTMDCIQPEQTQSVVGVEYIEPILNAILERNSIEIEYQKEGQKPETKIISPYVLKQVDHHWYMIGFDNLKTSLTKNYSLDKILSVKVSKQPYYVDENFDASQFFKYSFGIYHNYNNKPQKIKLEFKDPYINTIINYPLSPYQTHTLKKDGKKLTVNLELYDSWEIISEILKYGASVKVLAPKSLALKIKGIAEEIARGYE